MASLLPFRPHSLPLSPFLSRRGAPDPLSRRSHFGFFTKNPSPFLLRDGGFLAARMSSSPHLPDFETAEGLARELFGRLEGLIYTVADAAVSSDAAVESSKQSGDWLSGITNYMETVLKVLKDGLSALHIPYAYGFAIILLTVLVKAVTFPLTKKQVESALAMRSLQPQVKAIQQRFAGDQERIQLETARLYKLAGVNPLAGCLPTLATIPVWIGLYRALSNVANEGLLTEGFFWIPSLAGPTTIASRQSGSGTSWLFPFINSDPSQKSSQALTKFLPLMIGYFALSVPSGLSLYWFTNNILSTAQQIWLQKLGGAKNPVKEYIDRTIRDESSNIPNSVSNIQNSIVDIETQKAKSSQGEKASPGGLSRGERFKQIKEQEARRRKQREEENKRAKEVAEGSQLITEQQNSEVKILESKNKQEPDKVDTDLSMSNNGGLNGNAGPVTTNERSLHDNAEKEEVSEVHSPTGNQTSHDALDRRDQETE